MTEPTDLSFRLLLLGHRLSQSAEADDAQIRCAISTAYYAVFHAILTEAARRFIGVGQEATPAYGLIYRAFDHAWMRTACENITKPNMSLKTTGYFGRKNLGPEIWTLTQAFLELQEARHKADYSPIRIFNKRDAQDAVEVATLGIVALAAVPEPLRTDFLAYLLQKPR